MTGAADIDRRSAMLALFAAALAIAATAAQARGGRTSSVDCDSNDDDEACRDAPGKAAGKRGK